MYNVMKRMLSMHSKMMMCDMFTMIELMMIFGMLKNVYILMIYCENQCVLYSWVGGLMLHLGGRG
jgi:hypothetical protein